MKVSISFDVAASAERVWEAFVDVESWPQWTTSMTSVTMLNDGNLAMGSVVRVVQSRIGPSEWTITEFTPGEAFTWGSRRPGVKMTASHRVEQHTAQTSRLTLIFEQSGILSWLLVPIVGPTVRRYVELEARGHKNRAETTS